MALPQAFCARMEALLGKEADAFFAGLEKKPCRSLRFDPALCSPALLQTLLGKGLLGPVPFWENGFYFESDGFGNTPLHHSGAVYVQEPAAMAPVAALGGEKVASILDLCASPGGKSLQAATLLTPDGLLICNEPNALRRRVLMQNIERCGESRCAVTGFDGAALPEEFVARFDLVIADCPCSGEGMLRKTEAAADTWSVEKVLELAALQARILDSAARACAQGGRILFATCTWSREENEDNVAAFLARHPDFSLEAPCRAVAEKAREGLMANTLRFYPHLFDGEGQFLAIFRHDGSEKEPWTPKKKKEKGAKADPRLALGEDFLSQLLTERPAGKLLLREEELFLIPEHPFPTALFASPGVLLGSVQKGRIIPHHRFFRAYAHLFRNAFVLPLTDPRIEAYLRGEEIELEGKGYGVLFADTLPLGGVKASGGRGKNLYPKGLRKN